MSSKVESRKVRVTRSAVDYRELNEVDHILSRPDMYIGSTEHEPREELLLNWEEKKLFTSNITLPQGVERLFLEIISNAGDNIDNSRRASVNPGAIHVFMDRNWIKIRNGGLAIPVMESTSTPGKLVPEIVFGKLRSSSNYDDENVILMGCGKNGFGAKLTNVYSKTFMVTVGDNINKKQYNGTWQNNMRTDPISQVTNYTEKEGFVEVAWNLDFEKFKITEYPDEAFGMFARYAADFSLTCKVPVFFNGVSLDVRNIRDYAQLKWSEEECKKAILHHEWNGRNRENVNGICPFPTLTVSQKEKAVANADVPEHIPMVEILILDTPDEGCCLSYVNGMYTADGGVHVAEVMSVISSEIADIISSINRTKKDKDSKIPRLTVDDIRRHISVIINCRLPDPKYTSQSKTRLAGPKPHINIPEKLISCVKQWNLIEKLLMALEAKMHAALKKTNGGRTKHISLENGEDANEAGTDKSDKCILYLVEGKSASSYPKVRIIHSEGKQDYGGYFPLRGKFMNVKNASILKVAENKEVKAIKAMMGLREGVDYTQPENLATMRYGYIMICTDADSDGFHIASLLINYINQFYPGLLLMGRVAMLRTPVVRVTDSKDKILHRFYNNHEFDEWEKKAKADGTLSKVKVAYYKGLGRSNDSEIIDDLTTAPVVTIIYDDKAFDSLTLAFDSGYADSRKEWITRWREIGHIYDIDFMGSGIFRQQYVTNFINRELIDYTKDALFRAIPSQDDGLKRSHRQALYSALKYFNFGRKNEMMGVSKFANYAASETNYHHGEMSMCDTVVKMTQDFIGSNNLPWFKGDGQFGSRGVLGEDAASPRYIRVGLPKYAPLLYDEEIINCIPKRVVDTEEVEPLFVPAVIPMHLVNGVIGIATGYSTYIPSFNYYELINWCKQRCSGEIEEKVIFKPWFRGFKGTVFMETRNATEIDEPEFKIFEEGPGTDDSSEPAPETAMKVAKGRGTWFRTRGVFKIAKDKEKANLIITEVPIGVSMFKYIKWLETLVKEKVITTFRNQSSKDYPHFEITGYKLKGNPDPEVYKNIHMEKSATLNNITLIDHEGFPTKYTSIHDVLEVYSQRMLIQYGVVKDTRLSNLRQKMEDLNYRILFITAVVQKKIILIERKKKDILDDMASHSPPIPERYLKLVRVEELTLEGLQELNLDYRKLYDLYNETMKIKPENLWYEKLVALENYMKKEKY